MKLTRYDYIHDDEEMKTFRDGRYVLYTEAAQQIEALRTALESMLQNFDHPKRSEYLTEQAFLLVTDVISHARAALQSAKEGQA